MQRKITGDKEPADIVAAHRAIDAHIARHGDNSRIGKPILYTVRYRDKARSVEVTTGRKWLTAVVLSGKRSLNRVCNS